MSDNESIKREEAFWDSFTVSEGCPSETPVAPPAPVEGGRKTVIINQGVSGVETVRPSQAKRTAEEWRRLYGRRKRRQRRAVARRVFEVPDSPAVAATVSVDEEGVEEP